MTDAPQWPRSDYEGVPLDVGSLPDDGLAAARHWFEEALAWFAAHSAFAIHGNEVVLATSDRDGKPAARYVLARKFDERGVVVFTDRESRKGRELALRPFAALCFWWPGLHRQLRLEGAIEPTSDAESDAYFAARPRGSQVSAAASAQSEPVADRGVLEARSRAIEAASQGGPIERPARWGGYRLVPTLIEFWQGRPSRLHDRLLYEKRRDGSWQVVRLQP